MNLDVIEQHGSKVSWRNVMDLPQEKEKKDKTHNEQEEEQEEETREGEEITSSDEDENLMDSLEKLLAPGPTDNQIVIFQRQGCM